MKVAVPRETRSGERRVALVPKAVSTLTGLGFQVAIEPDAGASAGYPDTDYRDAGAEVSAGALDDADLLLAVRPIPVDAVDRLAERAITISYLPVADELDLVRALRDSSRTALAVELIPRISRAQAMDALSSQAMVAGYRSAVVAAELSARFFPLLMTSAGTVPPARVLVVGAGVAGLQAIATARRLGGVVSAYDVRAAAAEEVRSVGAEFIELDLPTLDGSAGYAREMTEERSRAQRELLTPYVAGADVLITTAAVPGRPAPLIVDRDAVAAMRPGSVVVDLAAEQGGNVAGSQPGERVTVGGAVVWGGRDVPSQMPGQASQLYANNLVALTRLLVSDGAPRVDLTDEILDGCAVTHAGEVRHASARDLLEEESIR